MPLCGQTLCYAATPLGHLLCWFRARQSCDVVNYLATKYPDRARDGSSETPVLLWLRQEFEWHDIGKVAFVTE